MKYTKYVYYDEIGDYVATEMSRGKCREYLTRYYKDNELLDDMISRPGEIRTMFGYVKITEEGEENG